MVLGLADEWPAALGSSAEVEIRPHEVMIEASSDALVTVSKAPMCAGDTTRAVRFLSRVHNFKYCTYIGDEHPDDVAEISATRN